MSKFIVEFSTKVVITQRIPSDHCLEICVY